MTIVPGDRVVVSHYGVGLWRDDPEKAAMNMWLFNIPLDDVMLVISVVDDDTTHAAFVMTQAGHVGYVAADLVKKVF